MRIYVTHCSHKKNDSLKGTGVAAPPQEVYTATPTQRFMARCSAAGVKWAIFSDLYGVWFPEVRNPWYEKDPNTVTESEFQALLDNFEAVLAPFDEIHFYYNPGRFHGLYQRLIESSALAARIRCVSHLREIV
jgi:hypothetical protein